MKINKFLFWPAVIVSTANGYGQYHETAHRSLSPGEIGITGPGSYAEPGRTYVLTRNITSAASTLFLGNDVVLDLNGYTLEYADAAYLHIPNAGFESDLEGWDVTKAPGAAVKNTADVHVFLGNKLLSLKAGDVIRSSYVTLPVPGRSYFAMCGVTGHYYHDMKQYPEDEMKVSVYVEDEQGKEVRCMNEYGDGKRLGCPVEKKSPRLGGGFVYAHLTGLPAGKYRVVVKADTDCLVDEIDIRPAMDAGISIIGKTTPLAHYDHVIMESYPPVFPAFYDFTGDMASGTPFPNLPAAKGGGSITIKNGIIRCGTDGTLTWGIQSTAQDVKINLDNVRIITRGISAGAADMAWADIRNCRFDVDMPFLIQRHVSLCSVDIRGEQPSEVARSEFYGGQGCLSIKGKYSKVHDNRFVNAQTVTNHYSIMGTGDSSQIYNNRFEPLQGSGIYVSRYTEVRDNLFTIETSPPTCEYGREEYSTAAVRLGDYHAEPGSPRASVGSRIHHNTIRIIAKSYPAPDAYLPMAWGVFYSASGGQNYIYDNDITVIKTDSSANVLTAALYICGGPKYFGGEFYNNRITTNVPAAWIASFYGGASTSDLHNNTITALEGGKFPTFTIGSDGCDDCVARDVKLRSNKVVGQSFSIQATRQNHTYAVYWTLTVKVEDNQGSPIAGTLVSVSDKTGKEVASQTTDAQGMVAMELPQYSHQGTTEEFATPYAVQALNRTELVDLNENKTITVSAKTTKP